MLQSLPIWSLAMLGRRTVTPHSNIYRHYGSVIHDTFPQNLSTKQSRSGQNLSDRYIRLEKSFRPKEASLTELEATRDSVTSTARDQPFNKKSVELFHGFELPEAPKPPDDNGEFTLQFVLSFWNLDCCRRLLHVWLRRLRLRPL